MLNMLNMLIDIKTRNFFRSWVGFESVRSLPFALKIDFKLSLYLITLNGIGSVELTHFGHLSVNLKESQQKTTNLK